MRIKVSVPPCDRLESWGFKMKGLVIVHEETREGTLGIACRSGPNFRRFGMLLSW